MSAPARSGWFAIARGGDFLRMLIFFGLMLLARHEAGQLRGGSQFKWPLKPLPVIPSEAGIVRASHLGSPICAAISGSAEFEARYGYGDGKAVGPRFST